MSKVLASVQLEKAELDQKIIGLEQLINSNTVLISSVEMALLMAQLATMKTYSRILKTRLEI